MPDVNSSILRRLRKARGYSQSTFAAVIGMKLSTYAYKEKIGEFDDPELEKITKTLSISNETLFKGVHTGHAPEVKIDPVDLKDEIIAGLKRENDLLRKQNETYSGELLGTLKEVQKAVNDLSGNLSQELKKGKTEVFEYPKGYKKGTDSGS